MSGRGSVSKYSTKAGVRWLFRFDAPRRSDGSRRQVLRRGFATKGEVVTALDRERSRYRGVVDPAEGSVSAYLTEWVAHRETVGDLRPSTADSYRRIVKQVENELGQLRLDRITAADLDRLYHHHMSTGGRKGKGRSARTTRYLHTIVAKALRDAVRKGLIPTNPADGATPPAAKLARPPEPDVWSVEEAGQFLAVEWLPTYRRIVWLVGLQTGLRRGELCGLRWGNIDEDVLEVVRTRTTANHEVIEGPPKSDRSRRSVHLAEPVVEALRRWRREQGELTLRVGIGRSEFVFTDNTLGPWHPDAMSRAWARDCSRAVDEGLASKKTRLHDLRHWHATALVAAGVDIRTVADRLGHADPGFTLRTYAHSDDDRDRAAAAVLARVLP